MTEETQNPRAVMGGNMPPVQLDDLPDLLADFKVAEIAERIPDVTESDLESLLNRMKDIAADAAVWLDLGRIEDEATAALASDQIAAMRRLKKDTQEAQRGAKKIWADKAAAAAERFDRVIKGLDRGLDKMLDMQGGYMKLKADRLKAEQDRLAKIAAEKRAEAEAAAARAEASGDIMGMADAEAMAKEAKKSEKVAAAVGKATASVGSATGAGRTISLRKEKVATIEQFMVTLLHYKDHPKLREALQTIVAADVRAASFDAAKDSIPGVKVTIEEKAA